MAKPKKPGDKTRVGFIERRSQINNPITGTWTKRENRGAKFMDVKAVARPFSGIRKGKRKK
jgi:hypothetical protein